MSSSHRGRRGHAEPLEHSNPVFLSVVTAGRADESTMYRFQEAAACCRRGLAVLLGTLIGA
jgi:hypothetical protein